MILGILAASVIPRFADLRQDALGAAVAGVAGSLSSAAAVNYAVRSLDATDGTAIGDCTNVANALVGGVPTGTDVLYSIVAAALPAGNGSTTTCTLRGTAGTDTTVRTFTAIRI